MMKQSNSHFLWPKVKFKFSSVFGFKKIKNLEKKFHKMFPSGYPVICSSGRVALYIALKELKFDRSKKINLYPYASHCVISATGRISNPSAYNKNNKMDVVYHQWGITYSCNHKPLVEDSVDSLYEKNTSLFANGSNFEVWSLPKIIGTSSGGILWCKKKSDAILIRSKLNHKNGVFFSWIIRLVSYKFPFFFRFWEGTEYGYKGLCRAQINEIFNKISEWDKLVEDRKSKLSIFLKYSLLKDRVIKGRLPSCLPIKTTLNEKKIKELGFSGGMRHFHFESKLEKIFPLPIHQDLKISFLNRVLNLKQFK